MGAIREKNQGKKFKSIVRRVIIWPLVVMASIGIISVVACAVTFINVQQRIIEANNDSLQLAQNQLDNYLSQIDHRYFRYWASEFCYKVLNNANMDQPIEDYAVALADNMTWMRELKADFDFIGGSFSYYSNIDRTQFNGSRGTEANIVLTDMIHEENVKATGWRLEEIDGEFFLLDVRKYGNHVCGIWIPVEQLYLELNIDSDAQFGQLFFTDKDNTKVFVDNNNDLSYYKDYLAKEANNNIIIGSRLKKNELYGAIPWAIYILLAVSLLSLVLIPIVIVWLKYRISQPLNAIDKAMQIVGEGNVDYRIPISESDTYDEFDRLGERLNQTLDELNDISFNLYETEIKSQRNRIRYLTEQIRPHFILNALNIIYTYDQSEFDLVKKMVLYLTEYFRYVVNVRKDFVKLIDEMHHVQNYLNIQKERYQNRFDSFVEWEVDTEQMYIPPLIIQSFVENCIKYGLKDGELTFIYVLAKIDNGRLILTIADTGNGFKQETIDLFKSFCETKEHQEGLGVGMETVAEGMDLLYGKGKYSIELSNALSGGAIVRIDFPIKTEE